MMAPGGNQELQERWDMLWKWLKNEKKTRPDQILRLQNLKQLLRDEQEGPTNAERTKRIQDLRRECISPFVADELAQLYACKSSVGLLFIHDRPKAFQEARMQGVQMRLFRLEVEEFGPLDEIHDLTILESAPIPRDQILPWAEAAAINKILFALSPLKFWGSNFNPDEAV